MNGTPAIFAPETRDENFVLWQIARKRERDTGYMLVRSYIVWGTYIFYFMNSYDFFPRPVWYTDG